MDYCILTRERLKLIDGYRVMTMRKSLEEMHLKGEAMRIPDHSLLMCNLQLEGPEDWSYVYDYTRDMTFCESQNNI